MKAKYREMQTGERIKMGDEHYDDGVWVPWNSFVGEKWDGHGISRRPVPAKSARKAPNKLKAVICSPRICDYCRKDSLKSSGVCGACEYFDEFDGRKLTAI